MFSPGKTMKKFSLIMGVTLLAFSSVALSQLRTFPQDAPRGYLKYDKATSKLVLNNKAVNTTPGLQIRDEANRIIFPQMVAKESIIKYTLQGPNLHKVWILTPYEIKQPDKHKLPSTVAKTDDLLDSDEDDKD